MLIPIQLVSSSNRLILLHLRRSISNYEHRQIANQMKNFNDQRKYVNALKLFDQYKKEGKPTDRMIVQALKASTKLKRLEQARSIHNQIDASSLNNEFILSTLISLYSQ